MPEQLELGARGHEHERIEVVELRAVHRLREHVCALQARHAVTHTLPTRCPHVALTLIPLDKHRRSNRRSSTFTPGIRLLYVRQSLLNHFTAFVPPPSLLLKDAVTRFFCHECFEVWPLKTLK